MKNEERLILEVLAGQSPGYLIAPAATAFAVHGLDAGPVEETLVALEKRKLAAHITTEVVELAQRPNEDGELEDVELPVLGDDNKPMVIAAGWCITAKGKEALA